MLMNANVRNVNAHVQGMTSAPGLLVLTSECIFSREKILSFSLSCRLSVPACAGDQSSILRFVEMSVEPFPLRWGRTAYMTAEIEILQDVHPGIRSVSSVGPMPFTRDSEIPCLADNFGSCNMVSQLELVCGFAHGISSPAATATSHAVQDVGAHQLKEYRE